MNFNLDLSFFTVAFTIAVEAIALIEAFKNFISKKNGKLPAWVYTIANIFLCFGLSVMKCETFTIANICEQLELGLLALAVSQLAYDSIWKIVKQKLNGATSE